MAKADDGTPRRVWWDDESSKLWVIKFRCNESTMFPTLKGLDSRLNGEDTVTS